MPPPPEDVQHSLNDIQKSPEDVQHSLKEPQGCPKKSLKEPQGCPKKSPQKLTESELKAELNNLTTKSGSVWRQSDDGCRLRTELKFPDFASAWSFMSAVAIRADGLNHHPNWSNVYNRVSIELYTHTENRLTYKDLVLGERIDYFARRLDGEVFF